MKFFIKTFGCRVNQVESQAVLEQFLAAGALPTKTFEEADLCLLNTCTVTHQADKDVEKTIRQILRRNPAARLVLTGCYASAHETKIKQSFPSVEIVGKYDLGRVLFGTEDICWTVSGHEGHSRAFVKIQDGCDCFCSYCIVPFARKEKRSKSNQEVLSEIRLLADNGFAEIVLTGINIGNYACPISGKDLAALCLDIAALPGEFRVRFSSIELQTVTEGVIDAMAQYPQRFCNYLHLPLQSGADPVLHAMNRHYTIEEYAEKIRILRKKIPQIGLFADVIAGFPTETEEDFNNTCQFITDLKLSGLHVFSFSPRPGTRAALLEQLPPAEIKKRAEKLREIDSLLRRSFAASLVNTPQTVFIEERPGQPTGLTGNFQQVILEDPVAAKGLASAFITRVEGAACYATLQAEE